MLAALPTADFAGCGGSRMAKCGVRLFTQAARLRSPRALHYVRNAIDGIDNVTRERRGPRPPSLIRDADRRLRCRNSWSRPLPRVPTKTQPLQLGPPDAEPAPPPVHAVDRFDPEPSGIRSPRSGPRRILSLSAPYGTRADASRTPQAMRCRETDHRHRRLLSARRKRPRHRAAAECG